MLILLLFCNFARCVAVLMIQVVRRVTRKWKRIKHNFYIPLYPDRNGNIAIKVSGCTVSRRHFSNGDRDAPRAAQTSEQVLSFLVCKARVVCCRRRFRILTWRTSDLRGMRRAVSLLFVAILQRPKERTSASNTCDSTVTQSKIVAHIRL